MFVWLFFSLAKDIYWLRQLIFYSIQSIPSESVSLSSFNREETDPLTCAAGKCERDVIDPQKKISTIKRATLRHRSLSKAITEGCEGWKFGYLQRLSYSVKVIYFPVWNKRRCVSVSVCVCILRAVLSSIFISSIQGHPSLFLHSLLLFSSRRFSLFSVLFIHGHQPSGKGK